MLILKLAFKHNYITEQSQLNYDNKHVLGMQLHLIKGKTKIRGMQLL